MEILLEFALQLFGEILVQGLLELGWRGVASPFSSESKLHPAFVICVYFLVGALSGAMAVWLVPAALIPSPAVRLANLVISPIVLGFAFELLGRRRVHAGKEALIVDNFSYGFTFALTFGLVRFFFTA